LTAAARLKVVADYVGGLCRKVVFAAVSAVYSPLPQEGGWPLKGGKGTGFVGEQSDLRIQ